MFTSNTCFFMVLPRRTRQGVDDVLTSGPRFPSLIASVCPAISGSRPIKAAFHEINKDHSFTG
ncbi:hypothetical protein E2C01_050093 [Portunus trituberculatus]|uniref:Uncharacterized protein n=1 Tax=Portunus trituberculatus TaxID=210409 RepID=A0A5B7G825_PORTR|nr:hypothetical protein [Portunus trituberculatus]